MDFGIDKILLTLLKENWLAICLFMAGLFLFRVLFEIVLPDFFKRVEDKILFKKSSNYKDDRDLLKYLVELTPAEFETYIAEVFRNLGYKAKKIGEAGDHGLDVEIEKDGKVSYIQCKKYSDQNTVGEPEVRNFLGSINRKHVRADAYFVTTSTFTEQAKQFVRGEQIILVDKWELISYVRSAEKKGFVSVKKEISKICPQCGAQLVERKSKYGKFIGCLGYPKCTYKETMS